MKSPSIFQYWKLICGVCLFYGWISLGHLGSNILAFGIGGGGTALIIDFLDSVVFGGLK